MDEKGSIGDLQCLSDPERSILRRQVELFTPNFTYFKFFRYSSLKDYFVLTIALSCAIVSGAATPLALVVFGELLDLFQDIRVEDVNNGDFNEELKKFTLFVQFYKKNYSLGLTFETATLCTLLLLLSY